MAGISRLVPGVVLGLVLGLALSLGPASAPVQALAPTSSEPAVRLAPPGTLKGVAPGRAMVQRPLEDRVLALTNARRRAHGCAPLRLSGYLRRAARGHTVTMARYDRMSHQLPGEPYFSKRITRAGYTRWRLVAENVARGFNGPEEVVQAWMSSPGHRRNLLNCRLRDLGVGVVRQDGQLWWTQNFGRR